MGSRRAIPVLRWATHHGQARDGSFEFVVKKVRCGDSAFLTDINPGNTVTGDIAFDLPKTASIARFELHDSAFSSGVSVANT
ncbi:MAG TPA: DUF4352 domain-containing protein [Actinocatenispora sp.]